MRGFRLRQGHGCVLICRACDEPGVSVEPRYATQEAFRD